MELVSADILLPYLTPNFPTASVDLIRSAVNRAAVVFCQKTMAIREMLDAQPVINSIAEYEVEVPDDMKLVAPVCSWYAGMVLYGKSVDNLNNLDPNWLNSTGTPCWVTSINRNTLRVVPTPAAQPAKSSMRTLVALSPKLDNTATKIPEDLAYYYQEAIICGAKWLMFDIRNQAWSDPQSAILERDLFETAVADARIEVAHGNVPGNQSVNPAAFG